MLPELELVSLDAEPLVLGLELPLAPMPVLPDEPELPEVLGDVLAEPELPLLPVEPLLPMLADPLEPLLEGEVVLPLVPAVLLPERVPAVSLPPFWPQPAIARAAAATTASAAPRGKREAFIWISLVGVWEDKDCRLSAAPGCLRTL